MRRFLYRYLIAALVMINMLLLASCQINPKDTKVVLTTGFNRNELFRIEEESCKTPEIMVYLTNIQNKYEKVYGTKIWATKIDGVTLEENVKETALAKMAQIKAMTLLAKKHKLALTDAEIEQVKKAAARYYESLNDTEIEKMGITQDTIVELYEEYALSEKLYHYLIKDINPEISDDEARTITVEHILIKTYTLDEYGNKVEFTEHAKQEALEKAKIVYELAKAGDDFDELISKYNEDNASTYSFGKGEMEPEFEEAAFNLGTDEISGVIETRFGYHIIKCISTFNREVTDANKIKIVEQRKKEVFGEEYDTFVQSLTRNLNKELWDEITFIHDEKVTTSDFFEVYDSCFNKK